MKHISTFLILASINVHILFSCKNPTLETQNKLAVRPISISKKEYLASLKSVDSLKKNTKNINPNARGELFSQCIDTKIIPHWIGTPWDYNGVTQIPNQGFIACGYFVTTVLRDAGISINRVKMAQCASETMIRSLTKNVKNYSTFSFDDFIQDIKSKGIGLSIIGLDNHTGFLYYNGKELYFIHSSFVGEGKVAKEIASENGILYNSKYKVVGFISKDETFIEGWK